MRIVGHGVDIVDIPRINRYKESADYLSRCFTERELAHSKGQASRLAGRLAAKEAVLKALTLGLDDGVSLTDVEVTFTSSGEPTPVLTGAPLELATSKGISTWLMSFAHSGDYAVASAIAICE